LATFNITVINTNDAPEFVSEGIVAATEKEHYIYSILVRDDDKDLGLDTLTVNVIIKPDWLSFGVSLNNTILISGIPYNEHAIRGQNTHQVILTVTDEDGVVATQDYTITVQDVNNPPVAFSVTETGNEDVTLNVNLLGTDEDHNLVKYVVVQVPQHGSLLESSVLVESSVLSYVPNTNYFGQGMFTFKAVDGLGVNSLIVTATLTINPVNDAPVAVTIKELTPKPSTASNVNISCPK
jgi:hypothetical protein